MSGVCIRRGRAGHHPAWLRALLLAAGVLLALPQSAWAFWNHDWSYRKQITIDPSAIGVSGKGDLSDVPVLIRLHEGLFRFADANADGSDLRFVADDDKTPLKFHIEKYDSVFNLAFIWVDVPRLKLGDKTNIWMYYGNTKAVSGSEPRETYDPDQVLVYHFGERGTPAADASGYANNSTSIATPDEAGLIGTGARFDGQSLMLLPASSSLNTAAGTALTLSLLLKPAAPDEDAVVYVHRDGARQLLLGLAKGAPYFIISGDDGVAHRSDQAQPIGDKAWHQLGLIASGGQVALYVDGKPGPSVPAALPSLSTAASLGGDTAAPGGVPDPGTGFTGQLDELQLSKVARDPTLLQLSWLNEGTADKLLSFGRDEQLSSWSSGYVGVILHSVTLDGWVIIMVLLLMAAVSWVVMVGKTRQVLRASRANDAFTQLFRAVGGDFSALNHLVAGTAAAVGIELSEGDRLLVQDAPLFHMFSAGVDELRQRLDADAEEGGKSAYLAPQSIEAIRAALDSSLVDETDRLDERMVLLTIAISGGPFIGLLGTVVGVMITFAAIAASGDVNVNSIAPGIAAALVATVAGLFVAIPALFGYNYLTTRIQRLTSKMRVFTDTFVTRMAESYKMPSELRALAANREGGVRIDLDPL